jgi:RNA polymerase sigma factor (sigma-70 family)
MSMTTADHRRDTELLLAYGRDGDEAAFEALARRHVDMIFSVSLRRSGNRQLAEEATQNVLVSLSMKARKLAVGESSLTGWLHTATKFEVSKLQRRESRIKRREQSYAADQMKTFTQSDDETFLRLVPLLDQAIDQLRAPDREVIVRRYLEGQDFRRIGEALGISEDTAQKRTSRAFDCLNQFFKRKAGVTLSATALVAGISQHCAEAAPSVCLQIAGKAASTGLASLFTTSAITTMSIGKISAVVAGIIVVGGAVAFLANQNGSPQETVSASPPSNSVSGATSAPQSSAETVAASTGGNAIAAADAKPYSPNEELAKLEAMSPHPSLDEMARRLSVKHEQLLMDLTADLGLNDAQVAGLKKVLDSRLKAFRASLDREAAPGAPPEQSEKEMITKSGSLIRGAGLRDELAGILSEKQLGTFDERETKSLQSQAESLSYRELSTLTPVLKLSEDQKDKVFEILQTSSAENLKQSGDARAFMALMQNKATTQLDFTSMADADFFQEVMDGPNALPPNSPEFKKRIIEFVTTQTNKQVELLAPVLDPRQKQRYHDHLISKSMLPMFGIKLPTPSEK